MKGVRTINYYIYKIINKVNGKIYVGQTTETIERRFKRHMGYQKDKHDTKFYRAVRKYGVENFYIELIEEVNSKEELDIREEFWIKELNSIDDGYNTALGKIGGDTLSKNPNLESIKKKISNGKKGGKNPQSTAINCIDIETNEKTFYESMSLCQEEMNIPRHDIISRRCLGKIKKPYMGKYLFEYA